MKKTIILTMMILLCIGVVNATSLTTNLVSYWNFDGNANDILGINNGSVGGAIQTIGKINQGYYFDGDADYINVGDIELPTAFTLSTWIKFNTTSSYQSIFDKWYDGNKRSFQLVVDGSGNYDLQWSSTGDDYYSYYSSTTPVNQLDIWYNIVMVVNGTQVTIYTNAANPVTFNVPSAIYNNNAGLYFGLYPQGDQFDFHGIMDEAGYWEKSLSSTEVSTLYNNGTGLSYPFSTSFTVGCQLAECKIPADTQILNTDPTIVQIQQSAEYTLTAGQTTNHTIWFVVNDVNGVDDLNDSTAYFNIGALSSESCTASDINTTATNYTCTIEIPFYTSAGNNYYEIGVYDFSSGFASYSSDYVTINQLDAIDYSNNIIFTSLAAGTIDNQGNVINFTNLGNTPYTLVQFTAYDSVYDIYTITAESYNMNYQQSPGTDFGVDATPVTISGASLPKGENSILNIYPWANIESGLPPGTYNSVENWIFAFS
jgi:Concanavalin A-like lectin/glucanases superfamily